MLLKMATGASSARYLLLLAARLGLAVFLGLGASWGVLALTLWLLLFLGAAAGWGLAAFAGAGLLGVSREISGVASGDAVDFLLLLFFLALGASSLGAGAWAA